MHKFSTDGNVANSLRVSIFSVICNCRGVLGRVCWTNALLHPSVSNIYQPRGLIFFDIEGRDWIHGKGKDLKCWCVSLSR